MTGESDAVTGIGERALLLPVKVRRRVGRLGLVQRRCPAGKQVQRVAGWRTALSPLSSEGETGRHVAGLRLLW